MEWEPFLCWDTSLAWGLGTTEALRAEQGCAVGCVPWDVPWAVCHGLCHRTDGLRSPSME